MNEKIKRYFDDSIKINSDEFLNLCLVPGIFSEFMNFQVKTAQYPDPVISFSSTFSLLSLLVGRRAVSPTGLGLNSYVLLITGSGTGKDHGRDCIFKVVEKSRIGSKISHNFASAESIEDILIMEKSSLLLQDEFDSILLQAKDPKIDSILSRMLTLLTSSGKSYMTRDRAGKRGVKISNPNFNIYGTCLPSGFVAAMSDRLASNGFLSRLFVFQSGKRGLRNDDFDAKDVPESLCDHVRWLYSGFKDVDSESVLAEIDDVQIYRITIGESSKALLKKYRDYYDRLYCNFDGDEAMQSVVARMGERTIKASCVYSCSVATAKRSLPEIDDDCLTWGHAISKMVTKNLLECCELIENKGSGFISALCYKILDHIKSREKTTDWVNIREIARKFHINAKTMNEVIETLTKSWECCEYYNSVSEGRGRPVKCIRLIDQIVKSEDILGQ